MPTRKEELSRHAARLFAERGYHGTSIGRLAEALGVQKGSLYSHIEGKQELLHEAMRTGRARPSTAHSTRSTRRSRRSRSSGSRCARICGSSPSSSSSRPSSCRSGATLRTSGASEVVAERRRYEERIRGALPRGPRPGRAALRPRRGCRRARLPLGRELGLHVAPRGRRHRRARRPCSGRCSWTACAATRRRPERLPRTVSGGSPRSSSSTRARVACYAGGRRRRRAGARRREPSRSCSPSDPARDRARPEAVAAGSTGSTSSRATAASTRS